MALDYLAVYDPTWYCDHDCVYIVYFGWSRWMGSSYRTDLYCWYVWKLLLCRLCRYGSRLS